MNIFFLKKETGKIQRLISEGTHVEPKTTLAHSFACLPACAIHSLIHSFRSLFFFFFKQSKSLFATQRRRERYLRLRGNPKLNIYALQEQNPKARDQNTQDVQRQAYGKSLSKTAEIFLRLISLPFYDSSKQ